MSSRELALDSILSVLVAKKSLNDFEFEGDSFATSLSFGVLRFYHHLNKIINSHLKKDFDKDDLDVFCILLLGAYQLIYTQTPSYAAINESVNLTDKSWARGLINAILRKISNRQYPDDFSHPKWLEKKIKRQYPENFADIFTQNNTQAPMTIRVNGCVENYQKDLERVGIISKTLDNCPSALVLESPVAVYDLPNFKAGSCYIQDASAQLSATILNPQNGDLVLDSCSAPGGKTTHLASFAPNAKIIAIDNNPKRLERVVENINRMQVENVETQVGDMRNLDWWDGIEFDKILLDAPCSAFGVIRRHPDIKILRKASDINKLVEIQAQILQNLWQTLKVGGTLLYATCSILEQENSTQIKNFLANNLDAKLENLALDWGIETIGTQKLPSADFDGFYYAKLIKT